MLVRRILAVMVAVAFVAGCTPSGDGGGPTGPDGDDDRPTFPMPEGAWLAMVRYETDPDRDRWYVYVSYQPETGDTTVSPLPMTAEGDAPWADDPLMVSADAQWTLRDPVPRYEERESGVVPIYRIADGSARQLDLRAVTGEPSFVPLGIIFDSSDADAMHVMNNDGTVWTVNLADETATASGTTVAEPAPVKADGYEHFLWAWARDGSGAVVQRADIDQEFADASRLAGLETLTYQEYDEQLPSLADHPEQVVRMPDGTAWAFDIEREGVRALIAHRLAPDGGQAAEWAEQTASMPLPDGSHHIAFLRQPIG